MVQYKYEITWSQEITETKFGYSHFCEHREWDQLYREQCDGVMIKHLCFT